jgi:pyruvate/2-oxoglutarate dehydrogenase complex dihydrolipoamide acyltransferase (E2) component
MRVSVKLPRLGDTVDEVVVMEWLVGVGESVAEGGVLLLVETDKAVVEVPSPLAGRLVEQAVKEGDEITTGTALAVLEAESP